MVFTIQEIKEKFNDRGYDLISETYTNQREQLEFICRKHTDKGIQKITYKNFSRSTTGCDYCKTEMIRNKTRLNDDDLKQLTNDKQLEFVSVEYGYENGLNKTIINFICPKHKYVGIQQKSLHQLKNGRCGCNYCNNVLDTYTFKEKLKSRNINIDFIGEYKGQDIKMEFICPIHKTHYMQKPRKIFEGVNGCPNCHHEFLVSNKLLTREQAQEKLNEKFPSLKIVGNYTNTFENTELYCSKHNCNFLCSINNFLYKGRHRCCDLDNSYIGEDKISDYLSSNSIKYETQKTFDDLVGVNGGKLSYDFYLCDYNTCIEFNGEQHYQPIKRFGGDKRFEKQQIHDKRKEEFCKNNNIRLIVIPYWEKENIDSFLKELLLELEK